VGRQEFSRDGGFVGDVRFRSLVGSIEEFSNWYGPGGPCTPTTPRRVQQGASWVRSSLVQFLFISFFLFSK